MPNEHWEQRQLAAALRRARVRFCHVPNGDRMNKKLSVMLALEGVHEGVPDVLVFDPPPAMPGGVGTALELKVVLGGAVSVAQREWLSALGQRGWATVIAHGYEDALRQLGDLGYPVR